MRIFLFLFTLTLTNICIAQEKTTDIIYLVQQHKDKLVHDLAGIFSEEEQVVLAQKLQSYQDSTSTAIKVVCISSLKGENIKALSLRIAKAWEGVDKQRKNAILILLATFEQKTRIELGRGIVSQISSEEANRILLDVFKPFAEKKEYYVGMNALINALTRKLNSRHKPSHIPSEGTQSLIFIFSALPVFFISAFFYEKAYKEGWMGVLIFCPWIFGVAYIIYTTPSRDQAYWIWCLIGVYIVIGLCVLFIHVLVEDNKSYIRKEKKLKEEQEKEEKYRAIINSKLVELSKVYQVYMGKEATTEWFEREKWPFEASKSEKRYMKQLEEIKAREKALFSLNKINRFFKQNEGQVLTAFYPPQLVATYLPKLQKYLLDIYTPPRLPKDININNILPINELHKLPLFDRLISEEDIDETEIKIWLEKLSNTKRLNTYKHYPIQLQDKKAIKNEKKLLVKRNKEMLKAKGVKETYLILEQVIKDWRMHDYLNGLLGRYEKEVKKDKSKKTNYPNTYHKRDNTSFLDQDNTWDNDYDNDSDVFGGDGADISW